MSKKVLVVDDSGVLRNIIVFNLKKAGYEIEQAVDGVDGLEKINGFQPDMIVLDIMMPRLDGFGVLKEKSKNDEIKDIPVIVLTAKGGEDDKDKALALGACDVLTKPFSPKLLINSVKQVIGDAS
ncbi:MAG TPA: response regulator [Thermotogota bacterium]|nr:response regulator [Thermotogota bacterium]HPJ88426.1 response regulator [Thermotogota bacterium]HPR95407.1 response regulator [Thermotogota bacterium]